MKLFFRVLISGFLTALSGHAFSQKTPGDSTALTIKDTLAPILTADSLTSGNYKDILTSFYQLAVNNLTGPNKEFRFSSTVYAIMLKNNPGLAVDEYYQRYKYWRKLNFNIDAKMDSAYHFNGVALGVSYALVDHRDITQNPKFTAAYLKGRNSDFQWNDLHILTDSAIRRLPADTAREAFLLLQLDSLGSGRIGYDQIDSILRTRILRAALDQRCDFLLDVRNHLDVSSNKFALLKVSDSLKLQYQAVRGDLVYNLIPKIPNPLQESLRIELESIFYSDSVKLLKNVSGALRKQMIDLAQCHNLNYIIDALKNDSTIIYKTKNRTFVNLRDSFQTRGLWTIGITDTSYSDGNLAKNLQFNTEWATALGRTFLHSQHLQLEWDLKANVNFTADTTQPGRNLKRQYWYAEPGFNLVARNKDKKSYLEFKVSGGITEVFNGRAANEKALDVTLNGTFRVRIFNEFWLPVQIKYDPQTGKVLGFLNVTMNFTGLSKLLKGKKSS